MQNHRRFLLASTVLLLTACAGGSSEEIGAFDPFNTQLTATSDSVSIANDNVEFELVRDETYDRGTFIAGSNSTEGRPDQILAFSESDDTFAAFLRSNDGGISADLFFGRRSALEELPVGSATLTGTYIGTFNEPDPVSWDLYIAGDTTLTVDFDEMTIGGTIRNRTAGIFVLGVPLFLSTELVLEETRLSQDGTFRGDLTVIDRRDGMDVPVSSGQYEGLLGGDRASEGVGRLIGEVEGQPASDEPFSTPALPETQEVGVFAVGH